MSRAKKWENVALGDVCKIIAGQSPSSTTYNTEGIGLPFFQGKADFGMLTPRIRSYCSEPIKIAEPGDILISVRAPVGPTNLCDVKSCIGRGLSAIRALDTVDTKYVLGFLRYYEPTLSLSGVGSTFKAITQDDLKSIPIPLPPLPEQKRIAAILDSADVIRTRRKAAIAKLDELAQSVFLEMFGDPVKNEKGWDIGKLVDLGSLDRGVSKHRPRNDPVLLGGPYPLVQTGEVANSNGYIRTHNATYSEVGLKQSRIWGKGTLCITIAANIAKTGILTFNACFPDSVVGFIPKMDGVTEYVRFWFSFLQEYIEEKAPASAQKNINLEILKGFDIPIPPNPLLCLFQKRIEEIEHGKMKFRNAFEKVDALFSSLQHRAFAGEL